MTLDDVLESIRNGYDNVTDEAQGFADWLPGYVSEREGQNPKWIAPETKMALLGGARALSRLTPMSAVAVEAVMDAPDLYDAWNSYMAFRDKRNGGGDSGY